MEKREIMCKNRINKELTARKACYLHNNIPALNVRNLTGKRAQFKIQQMAFMIVAVLVFFVLVGLAFVSYEYKNIKTEYRELQSSEAISSLSVIADMAELNCKSSEFMCLDEDKLLVMSKQSQKQDYKEIWPVASVEVAVVLGAAEKIECPAEDCNYYIVYDSGQENVKKYSTFVSLCKKLSDFGYTHEKCEIGKLIVGVLE